MRKHITRILAGLLAVAFFLAAPFTFTSQAAKSTATPGTPGVVNITSTSPELQQGVLARYNMIPVEIRNAFEVMNWRIEVTDMATILAYRGADAKQYPWYYELAGSTIADLKLIVLSNKRDYSIESINHEMGHFFDNILTPYNGNGRAGRRPEFYIIFNEEKAFLGTEYTSSSATEFFAEAFKYYVENPAFLAQACPKTYNYIHDEVQKYCTAYSAPAADIANLPAVTTARVTADGKYLYNGIDFAPVFNAEVYYARYPDLQQAFGFDRLKLFKHFLQYGVAEGRVAR